jgi:hypothetical protein
MRAERRFATVVPHRRFLVPRVPISAVTNWRNEMHSIDLKAICPFDWLLEPQNPSIRYWTLVDLLNRPASDPEVIMARAAILDAPPVAQLLSDQKRDGYWVKRDYYLPKHYGTFWVLTVLADLGLTAEDERIRRGCEFMFTYQREHGGFCRRRRVQGRGMMWDDQPGPCTHARVVRFLIQFGYAEDPRTQMALDWLLGTQREDGMWLCRYGRGHGCLRATLDYLRVAALYPALTAHPVTARAAATVQGLLMAPRMGRYHVKDKWRILEYPYFDYSLISALDALGRLGYECQQPQLAAALEYLVSRQLPNGAWPLDQSVSCPPLDVGKPGAPNKWLTLDAWQMLKAFRVTD